MKSANGSTSAPRNHSPGVRVAGKGTAMGSRGLTLSMLCGELIATRLHNEPLPLEAKLAQALSSERMARQTSANVSAS